MSSTSAPFGLRVARHQSGQVRPAALTIASAYATAIYENQPVKIGSDGTVQAAAVGDRFVGTFLGCEYTNSEGRRVTTNRWVASTVATDIVAFITRDPAILYEIQSSATIAVADIGSQADFNAISANSVVGISQQMLDQATLTNSGNASLRILGISPYPDNAAGDTYVICLVQISEHQDVADRVGY